MSEIIIGKFTLESLTNGMYASPLDLFREYVQNAVDSIDDATASGIISREEAKIHISVDEENRKIMISDNGLGISSKKASKVLLDIGNSEKDRGNSRGFRGIGRLAGLGYCDLLKFTTSLKGESKKTQVIFNAKLLREKLRTKNEQNETIFEVLDAVTDIKYSNEREGAHYFIVELNGVEKDSSLLEENVVRDYLVQNLPLEYSPDFHWGDIIAKKVCSAGYSIPSYRVFMSDTKSETQLFKCYSDTFVSDRIKRYIKNIEDVQLRVFLIDEKVAAVLWYAKADYSGTILDNLVKGIRIRQGNILIGNKNTTNQFFREERFNGWLLGELFVVNEELIPNARRDDFEETKVYLELKRQLFEWSSQISKEIRNISVERSASVEKKNAFFTVQSSDDENGLLVESMSFVNDEDEMNDNIDESSYVADNVLFDKFQVLLGHRENNYKYMVLNLRNDIPHEQRKMIEKVFDVLYFVYPRKKAENIAEDIIKNY